MPAALEVGWVVQAVTRRESRDTPVYSEAVLFLPVPDVVLAFVAFGIRIQAGVIAAVR